MLSKSESHVRIIRLRDSELKDDEISTVIDIFIFKDGSSSIKLSSIETT